MYKVFKAKRLHITVLRRSFQKNSLVYNNAEYILYMWVLYNKSLLKNNKKLVFGCIETICKAPELSSSKNGNGTLMHSHNDS